MPDNLTPAALLKILMQHADVFNVLVVIVLSFVIRPWIRRWRFFLVDRDRLLIMPMAIGVPLGFMIEYWTPSFELSVAIRRSLACGCGAAVVYRFVRVFFPHPPPPADPDPPAGEPLGRSNTGKP